MPKFNLALVLKLGVASLVVGTLLAVINLNPLDFWMVIWDNIVDSVEFIFGRGLDGLVVAARYTLYGAMVVIPIWIVSALLKARKKKSRPETPTEK